MLNPIDKIEIYELLARYTHYIDYGHIDDLHEIWTNDCSFKATAPTIDINGLDELKTFFRQTTEHSPNYRHLTSNQWIEEVEGKIIHHAYLQVVDVVENTLIASGRYADIVTNTDNGWRISSRQFYVG